MPSDPRDPAALRFGIEAEYALVDAAGRLADFRTLTWRAAQRIVDRLGTATHPALVRGDAGIKSGRWYVEGDERFDDAGRLVDCVPKGIETRTPPVRHIAAAVDLAERQTSRLVGAAAVDGYQLTSIGWNPVAPRYDPVPPYNVYEQAMRRRRAEYVAPDVYMMSYGPDLNLSHPAWSDADAVDVARRLTAVSPLIVPFSFSSPFAEGRPAGPLSVRTVARTGRRPAARVFVGSEAVPTAQPSPPLIHAARSRHERGRVEFKAFDALIDPGLYAPLLALLTGLALWRVGRPRADVPDGVLHARAGTRGFADPAVRAGAAEALSDAHRALAGTRTRRLLAPLAKVLRTGRTASVLLLDTYRRTGAVPYPATCGTQAWGHHGLGRPLMVGMNGETARWAADEGADGGQGDLHRQRSARR